MNLIIILKFNKFTNIINYNWIIKLFIMLITIFLIRYTVYGRMFSWMKNKIKLNRLINNSIPKINVIIRYLI